MTTPPLQTTLSHTFIQSKMSESENNGVRYKGKVTIVTGGATGIGKGIVTVFVRHGAKVVFVDINEVTAKETEASVNAIGPGEAKFIKCDVTNKEEVTKMVVETVAKYGQIDCLINNAGIMINGNTDTYDIDNLRLMNEINIVGPFIVAQACLPHLRKVKGNIINITSVSGIIGGPSGSAAYATTKAAGLGFTKSLALEEGSRGVRVNGIAPSAIQTELFEKFAKGLKENQANFFRKECNVMGRMGQPEEIGMACLFLAADATYSTGAILNCTGGTEIDYGVKAGPNHYSNF